MHDAHDEELSDYDGYTAYEDESTGDTTQEYEMNALAYTYDEPPADGDAIDYDDALAPVTAVHEDIDDSENPLYWVRLIVGATTEHETEVYCSELHAVMQRRIRVMTAQIINSYRLDRNTWFDDVEARIVEAMFVLVTQVKKGEMSLDEIRDFSSLVRFRGRSRAQAFLNSTSGLHSTSGQVGQGRKLMEMRQVENELTMATGRVPSPQEVVDETNRRRALRHKDPKRQGLVTLDDYHHLHMPPTSPLDEAPDPAFADPNEQDGPIHSAERDKIIRLTVERCRKHSQMLGDIAVFWFNPATTDQYDGHPNATEVAAAFGIAPQTARAKIATLKHYAREVLKVDFGIEGI